ncbi:hypothetical protein FQN49_001996 [Arthroderma sp. PD_2]|nr:hypothetical protein FQN49_001996 [Arthroderma sp. PD_2]
MTAQRECVRLNPHFVVGDANIEETAVIKTVLRPLSNDLFSSRKIRLFGPLGVAIPLREMTVGLGDYYHHTQDKQKEALPDWLPNPPTTVFYTPYPDQDLDATQFEIIWQFNRFIHGKEIEGIDDVLAGQILTVNNKVPMPTTVFNPESRRYVYQGWTRAHFVVFFNEYCASKVTAAVINNDLGLSVGEWMNARPPEGMTEDDWGRLTREIGSLENIFTDEAFGDVGSALVEYSGVGMGDIVQRMKGVGASSTTTTRRSRGRARVQMRRGKKNRNIRLGKYLVVHPTRASKASKASKASLSRQCQIVLSRRRKSVRRARVLRRRARVTRKGKTPVNRPVLAPTPKASIGQAIDLDDIDDLILIE